MNQSVWRQWWLLISEQTVFCLALSVCQFLLFFCKLKWALSDSCIITQWTAPHRFLHCFPSITAYMSGFTYSKLVHVYLTTVCMFFWFCTSIGEHKGFISVWLFSVCGTKWVHWVHLWTCIAQWVSNSSPFDPWSPHLSALKQIIWKINTNDRLCPNYTWVWKKICQIWI